MLKFYKRYVSSNIELFFGPACRFYPTCSEYADEAIGKYGIFRGGIKSLLRLMRCNPFVKPGYDPVD